VKLIDGLRELLIPAGLARTRALIGTEVRECVFYNKFKYGRWTASEFEIDREYSKLPACWNFERLWLPLLARAAAFPSRLSLFIACPYTPSALRRKRGAQHAPAPADSIFPSS
jgi:hypothetical protein